MRSQAARIINEANSALRVARSKNAAVFRRGFGQRYIIGCLGCNASAVQREVQWNERVKNQGLL